MVEILKWDGKSKISKPGIYSNVPIGVYHSDCCEGPSASSSNLRTVVNESPADYWDDSYLNPHVEPKPFEESEALLLGRALHDLILSQGGFSTSFVIQPEVYVSDKGPDKGEEKKWTYAAGFCKAWRDIQRKANRSILTMAQVDIIKGMAKTLARDTLVKEGILNGLVEHSLFWRDKKTGIWLKARPDAIPVSVKMLARGGASVDVSDLKSIAAVDYIDMENSYDDNGYYMQTALIRQGLKEVLNLSVSTFTLMFAAKKRPFSTRPVILDEDDLQLGDDANRVGLDVMARCIKDGEWPGPGRGPGRDVMEKLKLSEFRVNRIRARIDRLKDTFELNR